jgi:NAD(P)-dependent dehydrogenase (short-subunit alcohol dehydrogenase family)
MRVPSEGVDGNRSLDDARRADRSKSIADTIVQWICLHACRICVSRSKDHPKDFLKTLQPMGQIAEEKDIVDAIVYLTEAGEVTGEVLHVDGGAHVGKR